MSERTNMMVIQLRSHVVPEEPSVSKVSAKKMSEIVIMGVVSFGMILLGLIMSINICLAKKH